MLMGQLSGNTQLWTTRGHISNKVEGSRGGLSCHLHTQAYVCLACICPPPIYRSMHFHVRANPFANLIPYSLKLCTQILLTKLVRGNYYSILHRAPQAREEDILKCTWKHKSLWIVKSILSRKRKSSVLYTIHFKAHDILIIHTALC